MTIVRVLRTGCAALALGGVFAVSACAQPGAYTFTAPAGWVRALQGDTVVFTPKWEPPGSVKLMLMPVKPRRGNFDAQFAAERAKMERLWGLGNPQAIQPQRGRSNNGEYGVHSASYTSSDGDRYVTLMALGAKGAFGVLAFMATSGEAFNRLAGHATATFNSLKLSDAAASSTSSSGGAGPPDLDGAPPAPVSVATAGASTSGGTAAVSYDPPSGWSRSTSGSATLFVRTIDLGFGMKNDYRLFVFPAERVQASAMQTFSSLWKRMIEPAFNSALRPLPLRVRLRSGAALLYDGDAAAILRQNNAQMGAFLYMATDGNTAVPVVGMYIGWSEDLKRDLDAFFGSLRIGSGGKATPLFSLAEIAGTWRSSSSALANWVDAYGNYRGDASIATGETMTIRADGTCESRFAAIVGGRGATRQHDAGRCSVDDDMLVFPSEDGARRYRITGVGRSADARAGFLLLSITRDDYPFLHSGSRQPDAGNLYVSVP
jgi:hypothetical protein